jgi:hypothetical protein
MATRPNPQTNVQPRTPPNPETQGLESKRRMYAGDREINPVPMFDPGREQPVPSTRPQPQSSNDITRAEERRGTRQIWMWGIALIAAIFVALLLVSFLATT